MNSVTPNDTRYIPFTQQKCDCVPTSISMIMYRNNIPLIPTEELGYYLGLTIPPKDEKLYYKPRVSETPPSDSGIYGTQIQNPNYDLNKVFTELGIPLKFDPVLASKMKSEQDLFDILSYVEKNDTDAIICFNYSVAHELPYRDGGHAVVFDKIIDGKIRIVDPWYENPKWQLLEPELLYKAIRKHGDKHFGGIWQFRRQKNDPSKS